MVRGVGIRLVVNHRLPYNGIHWHRDAIKLDPTPLPDHNMFR